MKANTLRAIAAFLILTACAAYLGKSEAPEPAPVAEDMMMEAPAPARAASPLESCTGDGIGGTGCPEQ